ncbi:toll-like receptor 6 [Ptychodera flava]|uniref:toll-like receptor 6 n=1 Tax=Ptychodera flava TaxID=63121 RepID=UPI00396A5D80
MDCLNMTHNVPWKYMKTLKLHDSTWSDTKEALIAVLKLFPNLEELTLKSLDALESMAVLPDTLTNLQTLDISYNQITKIDSDLLKSLPNLNILRIHDNPLSCSKCEMNDFVQWLKKDKRVLLSGVPKCATPMKMNNISVLTLDFGLECNLTFIISVPILCFAALALLTIVTGIQLRWHIRYLLFMLKLKRGGYQLQINDEEQRNKKYDAFVVYNEHDGEWVMQELIPNLENTDQQNLKLCIHERDFIPGDDIFENILNSIENSNKTLLLLSPHFAQSEWCYFEMRMAQTQLFEEKKDVILMVMLQEIPDDMLPRVLRKILMTKKYLEWPENDLGRRMFLQKLRMALKSESKVNRIAQM